MGSVNTGGLNWARYDNRDKLQAMVEQQRAHKVNIACISELHNTAFLEDQYATVLKVEEFTYIMIERCGLV